MKKFILLLLVFTSVGILNAQDKKQLKGINKKYNIYSKGDIFAKADKVAILGNNLRFKLASRQSETNSWKDEKHYKFAVYSVLEGLSDDVLQEITDKYYQMLTKRFEDLGIEVLKYETIQSAKSYGKLKDKGEREKENIKKSWGIAKIFVPGSEPYITWNNASPFGPHQKLAKELDAVLISSLITIDFADIGVDINQHGKNYYGLNERVIYTEAKSSVVPNINIIGYTYSKSGTNMFEDNTYMFNLDSKGKQLNFKLDLNQSEISSDKNFAISTEKCENCEPVFAKSYLKIMERGMGTVLIKADPELYKVAVLDALSKYLDEVFMVIKAQRK